MSTHLVSIIYKSILGVLNNLNFNYSETKMFLQNKYCMFPFFTFCLMQRVYRLKLLCFVIFCYTSDARVQCVTCAARHCTFQSKRVI